MQCEMILGLKDVPGMLVKALEPISEKGGNIVSVVHMRGGQDFVGVNIIFKVKDKKTLERISNALKKRSFEVKSITVEGEKYYSKITFSFIYVGHVIDKDIQDTIDRINEIGLVRDVDVRMSDPTKESAVLMRINVDEKSFHPLMSEIEKISKEKKFMLIREVGK